MNETDRETETEGRSSIVDSLHGALGEEIDERLRSVKSPTNGALSPACCAKISRLPLEHTRAALETSAAIAGDLCAPASNSCGPHLELRSARATELRAWGEIGRRLTMGDVENGVSFFC